MSGRTPRDPAPGARPSSHLPGPDDCPLETMRDEHYRQRALCTDMETLAATQVPRPDLARTILINLCRELPTHTADEELGLLPRLCARATPEDEIGILIDRLEDGYRKTRTTRPDLIAALACLVDGALPAPEDRSALRSWAQSHRRHLTLKNAVLLPLARSRLTNRDHAALLSEMRARRSTPPALDTACASALSRIGAMSPEPEGKDP